MLPLGGMFTALFVGWVWTQQQRDGESGMPPKWSNLYGVLVKFVAPVLVFIVFVESVT
jgi:NSS family neurotransmitter:Na+ symporter